MLPATAGDPITGLKWTRKTTVKLSDELRKLDTQVGARTVARLLEGLKYRLRVNHKKLSRGSAWTRSQRNQQFLYIEDMRREHRLFSQISKNWAGEPLATLETMLNFIRTTKTETGLRVRATLMKGDYPKGLKPTAAEMATLPFLPHDMLPDWNYTIASSSKM